MVCAVSAETKLIGNTAEKGGIDIAIYHCSIKIVSRGKGKSAVAAAAYRSGEKLTNEYDGHTHDFTRKRGIVHTEILLPTNAPQEYTDRETLWNAVEQAEKAKNSQLAREVEIAMPNELTIEECAELARKFTQETFVNKGMVADICIHNPDKAQKNIHAHILLTMRPFSEDGTWGDKQRKEYILDKNGEKIYDKKKRQYKCKSIPTTDWNCREKAEEWRTAWETFINAALSEKNITELVDHRSFVRQGKDEKPTIHMGVAATQMERKGIRTVKGDINRQIRADNEKLAAIKHNLVEINKYIAELSQKPQEEELVSILLRFWDNGKAFAEAKGMKLSNMKKQKQFQNVASAVAFLQGHNIRTVSELATKAEAVKSEYSVLRDTVSERQKRMTELAELIDNYAVYKECRAVADEYSEITNAKKKNAFADKHCAELTRFKVAKKAVEPYRNDKGKFTPKAWKSELDRLTAEAAVDSNKLNSVEDKIATMETILYNVQHLEKYEERQEKSQQKKRSGELE